MFWSKKSKTSDDRPELDSTEAQELQKDVQAMAETAAMLGELLVKSGLKPEEKEAWFSLLPTMTEEQIIQLRDILIQERLGRALYPEVKKLMEDIADINEKYDKKILAAQENELLELGQIEKQIKKLEQEQDK